MYVYLSHALAPDTPCYRDARNVKVTRTRNLDEGAPVNAHRFEVGGHDGTHVDAPLHFVRDGRPVDSYDAGDWVFAPVALLDVVKDDSELIAAADLAPFVARAADAELLLIRTGFERHRVADPSRYAARNPGFSVAGAQFLYRAFPRCRALGLDVISLAAVEHVEEGFAAHRELLFATGRSVLIAEDMHLAHLDQAPARVIMLPLRVRGVDGAPVTAIAEL
jgi:kynurenine formamidase